MNTLEQRIKSHPKLKVGTNCVTLTHNGMKRKALVKIDQRGHVEALVEPQKEDMYSAWRGIEGNDTKQMVSAVILWGARDPDLMKMFAVGPVAEFPLLVSEDEALAA